MNNASLELGGTNWAEKDGNILGYSVGDTSGKYSPQEFTFARGSNLSATRIDRAGLIVKGRENLLLQSNQFDTTWGLTRVAATSGQADPNGGSTAWKITESTNDTATYCYLGQSVTANTISFYAKAGEMTEVLIYVGVARGIYFDLTDGSFVGYYSANTDMIYNSTSVGGGWYRYSVFYIGMVTAEIYPAVNGDLYHDLVIGNGFYLWRAQAELGTIASPYIESGATNGTAGVLENTPRLNYTTGVANPYLLLEPSRTNLISQSEYFGGWTLISNGTGSDPVLDFGYISPGGLNNAYKITLDSGAGTATSDESIIYLNKSGVTAGSEHTASVYLKGAVGGEEVIVRDTAGGYKKWTLTTEWARYEYTQTATATSYATSFGLRQGLGGIGTINSNAVVYIYGFQSELGSYPTSYIPTYSVSATRAQDVCNKTNASGEIGQTEGTMFVDLSNVQNLDFPEITIDNNSNTDRIVLTRDATGNWGIFVASSVTTPSSNVVYSAVGGTSGKFAIAYSSIGYVLYRNGVQISTLTYGLPSALSVFRLNGRSTNDYNSIKNINQAQLYTTRLTDAELATLTTI